MQKEYLQNVYINFAKFKEIQLDKKFENKNFNHSINVLFNTKIIKFIKNLLESFKLLLSYNGIIIENKVFFSLYLISYHPFDVLSSDMNRIEKEIYDEAKLLVNELTIIDYRNNLKLLNLIKNLNRFKNIFKKWKSKDLKSQLEIYCEIYKKYTNQLKYVQDKEKKLLIDLVNKIKINIEKLGNDNIENILKSSKIKTKIYDESFEKIILKNLKIAFWNDLKTDFNSAPIILNKLPGILDSIKANFIIIYKKNDNMKKYICDSIDSKYITKNIENNYITLENIKKIVIFLLLELNKVDSKEFDKNNKKLQKEIKNCNNEDKIKELIIESLFFTINRLEWINNVLNKVKLLKVNINIKK